MVALSSIAQLVTRPLKWSTARLRARPDSEHEMSANRLVFAFLIIAYLLWNEPREDAAALRAMALFFVLAIGIFAHILAFPKVCRERRLFALALDMGFMFWQMHIGDRGTSPIFPLYLWVIFGNGFRFGLGWLRAAMVAGVASFGAVVLTTSFWWQERNLSVGLLIGLVILPLYAGTLIRKLSQARAVAEQASRAKSMFLASVSHELRTPLTAIIATSYLMQDSQLDPPRLEMARTIDTAARSLLRLIDGILNFSRIEAGQVAVEAVAFDLLELLAEVRQMIAVQARQKGLQLAFHISADTPPRIEADRHRIQEILLNLAGNAVKFTHEGSIAVAVRAVAEHGAPLRLRFQVSDTGIGIAPEAQAHIFDSFVQADETIINRYGGTGLGLAISKRLAEALGGAIGLDSVPGEGSDFWFTVRAKAVEAAETAPPPATAVLLLSRDRRLAEAIGRVLPEGPPALNTAWTLEAARRRLGELAAPRGARVVALLDCRDVPEDHVTAARLLADDPARALSLVLVDDAACFADRGVRHHYVTSVAVSASAEEIRAALRISALAWPGTENGAPAGVRQARQRLRVLVADDNHVNQQVLLKILERAGHDATAVDHGEAALDLLDGGTFDIVLMDVNMPVMDGIEATKMYRMTSLGQRRASIIGLTADASPEAAERCLQAGMDACLTKPVQPAGLLEQIDAMGAAREAGGPDKRVVTPLAAHPRYRAAAAGIDVAGFASVDAAIQASLVDLGGEVFFRQIKESFLLTADGLVAELTTAVAAADYSEFRKSAHALSSAGANLGTTRLCQLCAAAQECKRGEFALLGNIHLKRMVDEVEAVRRAFAADGGAVAARR